MRRLLMVLSAFCLVLAVTGCSGDDDGGQDGDKAADDEKAGATLDPKEARKRIARTTDCTAEVSTTGAYEAEWKGKAQVRTGGKAVDAAGPKAIFELTDKKNRVALYSPGPGFKGSVSLSAAGVAYSSDPADAEDLEIDKRGRTADVDVTLTSTGGETVELEAEFTCGKSRKRD